MAEQKAEPSQAKQIGITCGLRSASCVAKRAIRAASSLAQISAEISGGLLAMVRQPRINSRLRRRGTAVKSNQAGRQQSYAKSVVEIRRYTQNPPRVRFQP